jgi:hypothetical protein
VVLTLVLSGDFINLGCSAETLLSTMLSLVPTTLRLLFASLLWSDEPLNGATPLRFQLRHQHAVSNGSRVVFSDVVSSFASESYAVSAQDFDSHRPASYSAFDRARLRSMRYMQSERVAWDNVKMLGPNVQSRETLLQLAQMTHNSYFESGHPHWYDLGERWNTVCHPTTARFASFVRLTFIFLEYSVRMGTG